MKKIIGLCLAAGQSARMGTHKLALPLAGLPLGSHVLQAGLASQLNELLVITREEDALDWIAPSFHVKKEKWRVLPCADAALGQSHSLKKGVHAAEHQGANAVLILLADQPFVTARLIDDLIDRYQEKNADYVAAIHNGIARPPVLFDRSVFPKLLNLQGDAGARLLLRKEGALEGACIEYEDALLFYDVDTWEEYVAIQEKLGPA